MLSTGSNDVYVVRGERGELLLPALDDVILSVDVKGRSASSSEIPDGLEFTPTSTPAKRPGVRRPERSRKTGGAAGQTP